MTTITLDDIFRSSGCLKIKIIKACDLLLGGLLARILPARKHFSLSPLSPQKILIIRPGGMGDAILLLPIIKALRIAHPTITIDILCEKRNADIFTSQMSLVDHIHLVTFSSLCKIWRKRYDVVLDTEQWHYLSALTTYMTQAPITIGFATRSLRKKLFNIPVSYEEHGQEAENFFALFAPLLPEASGPFPLAGSFLVPEETRLWATRKIPTESVIISLGASVPERRLTPAQIVDLANALLSRGFCPVFLGGSDVARTALTAAQQIAHPRVFNFAGTTSLVESAALIQQSRWYIGPDSGLLHLAVAIGSKTITIFGPGNIRKWAPQGAEHTVISHHLPCAPCTRFGYTHSVCHNAYPCMRNISTNEILRSLPPCP